MTLKGFFTASILTVLFASVARGQMGQMGQMGPFPNDGEHIDITIKPVRWQALPEQVFAVFVGPDQRVWYQLNLPQRRQWTVDWMKRTIEREFNEPSPQIIGARPYLFEKNGRVWFLSLGPSLLGYDGKTWIEYYLNNHGDPNWKPPSPWRVTTTRPTTRLVTRPTSAPVTRPTSRALATQPSALAAIMPRGALPNHLAGPGESQNLQVGDTLFFPANLGVLTYDTRANRWDHQIMARFDASGGLFGMQIRVDADQQGVSAIVAEPRADQVVWRWRAGQWSKATLTFPHGVTVYANPLATQEGVWVRSSPGNIEYFPDKPGVPPDLGKLIEQLGAGAFADREKATAELVARGSTVRNALIAAKESADPESVLRMDAIIKKIDATQGLRIGDATVQSIDGICPLDGRRVLLAAHDSPARTRNFIVDPQGGAVECADLLLLPTRVPLRALKTGDPDRVWVPRDRYDRAALLDLKTGKVIETLPDVRFNHLHAIKADGTLFAGPTTPGYTGYSKPIMVYQGAMPDDRAVLKATPVPLALGIFCVAADGAVWGERKDMGIARFDGKTWTPVAPLAKWRGLSYMLGGIDGTMLCGFGRGVVLIKGDQIIQADTIEKLIEQNRETIRTAFVPSSPRNDASTNIVLFSDPSGNIWLKQGIVWNVLTGAGWQDGVAAGAAAVGKAATGKFAAAGRTYRDEQLIPVGDGSRALLFHGTSVSLTHVARVEDGKLKLDPIPRQPSSVPEPGERFMRDHDGSVYMPGRDILRMDKDGKLGKLALPGTVRYCDDDGSVWIATSMLSNQVVVWKEGEVLQKLEVPYYSSDSAFFSGGPGIVYIHNNGGLQRFRKKEGQYVWDTRFWPEEIPQGARRERSNLGFLIAGDDGTSGGNTSVKLFDLPP